MQLSGQKHLKTIVCQLGPEFKQKTYNIERTKVSLQHYSSKDQIDIVLLPEMSFTGYNFENFEDALPQAVEYGQGEEFQFAKAEAIRIKAYVIFGYLEKQQKDGQVQLFNSAAVYDREGHLLLNYRKQFLYYADSLWCTEAKEGFKTLVIHNTKGQSFKCAIAICMDINPKNFTSGQFELAEFIGKEKAEVLLFLTNWVDHEPNNLNDSAVVGMYEYWINRLRPLLSLKESPKRPILFLAADRVGTEHSFYDKKQCSFFGCSCGMMINPNYVIGKLDKKKEGYLVIEAKLPELSPQ